jgi:hypothetical protein
MAKGAAFVRGWIEHDAIALTALMSFGQVLSNREPIFPDEQQAVTIFIDLHFIAGADPPPELGLRLFIWIIIAGTERLSQFVDVCGETFDDRVGHLRIWMKRRAALFREAPYKFPDLVSTLILGFRHTASRFVYSAAPTRATVYKALSLHYNRSIPIRKLILMCMRWMTT